MKPRVLIISHTYAVTVNRPKVEAIAALGDLDLALVVPPYWSDILRRTVTEVPSNPSYPIHVLPTFLISNSLRFFFDPISLWRLLRKFKPDIILIEEEPWSLSVFETRVLNNMTSRAQLGFFTWENLQRSHRFPGNWLERLTFRAAQFGIAGNHDAAQVLKRKGFTHRVITIPQLGLDTKLYQRKDESIFRGQLGLCAPVIGFAGRLVEEKGIFTLLDSVSEIGEPFMLMIVGNGPLRGQVAERIAQPPLLGRAVLLDPVPHGELVRYINCMDILVSASHATATWTEQYGLVVLAAMSCGLPVVGTNCGETPYVIGDTGLVCREKDPIDLREKLETLLSDSDLRSALGNKARARVLAHFTNAQIAQATNDFLTEIFHS